MNDLSSALESCQRALALERAYVEPDSERLLTIDLQLQALERELNVR
jgi:hypothetical protein